VIRQTHLIPVVGAFLIGCAVLLAVGCAGARSQAPQKEKQGHTEATAFEEARCEGTRTFKDKWSGWHMTTNDIPGCPKGGLLSGTDGRDYLGGKDGDDEIHGLGDKDYLLGGMGSDVIYGGPGDDPWLYGARGDDVIYGGAGNDGGPGDDAWQYGPRGNGGRSLAPQMYGGPKKFGRWHDAIVTWPQMYGGPGEDVIYGGDGNDSMSADEDKQRDKLYCGEGRDYYLADKNDYVDSSCEIKGEPPIP
jgi:Ca2+-binding RTX toxin-like protein